jgi:hypothetical protein
MILGWLLLRLGAVSAAGTSNKPKPPLHAPPLELRQAGGGACGGGGGAAQCASDLARVALAVYEAGGKAIHVPLPSDHHLISVIAAALASGGLKEEGAGGGARGAAAAAASLRKGSVEVAGALLDQVVQLQGNDADGGGGAAGAAGARFGRLLALHALAGADPSLLVPPRDRQRFLRALAPYATPPDAEVAAKATQGERQRGERRCNNAAVGA